jgi:CBS domain-containing protein
MVTNVITVGPDATVYDVANVLLANRISAVPVVDAQGHLVGIVSEGDLIRRAEIGTEQHHSWWLTLLTGNQALANEYIKCHARKVADIMTHPVITATPETPLSDIATLLERNRIKRVPIVANGKLVGVVSRANLVQALASVKPVMAEAVKASDTELRDKIMARLSTEPWRPSMLNVTVHDGTVHLWGVVGSEAEKKAALTAAELTPGVRAVVDNLMVWPAESGWM